MNEESIRRQLHTTWAASYLIYRETTGSTNTDAAAAGRQGAPHGTLVVADRQEQGRGSRGRSWETPKGTNIAMSLLLRPAFEARKAPMLTLLMALSIAESVRDVCEAHAVSGKAAGEIPRPGIKWPNDVVIGGRKICGILTESEMTRQNTIDFLVIGVGINVTTEAFSEEIRPVAGSILTQTGIRVRRSALVARAMRRFEDNYGIFLQTTDFSRLKKSYETVLLNKGNKVRVLDPSGAYEGAAHGITETGELLVEREGGVLVKINAGEVSVRGVYGYV